MSERESKRPAAVIDGSCDFLALFVYASDRRPDSCVIAVCVLGQVSSTSEQRSPGYRSLIANAP